jgi:cyanoexosortase B-associated protein
MANFIRDFQTLKGVKFPLNQRFILFCLTLLVILGALPGYFSGHWPWQDLPPVTEISRLVHLRQTGLSLKEWKTLEQKEVPLGEHRWSVQLLDRSGQDPLILSLMPQTYYREKPEITWITLQQIYQWQIADQRTLIFGQSRVQARFFQAWNHSTWAILEWYAWPGGGSNAAFQWFWRDQLAQLRQQRLPWVAVSVQIPMDAFSDLKEQESLAKSVAESIQSALETQIFSPVP